MPRSTERALGIALPARNVALARGLAVQLSWLLASYQKEEKIESPRLLLCSSSLAKCFELKI